MLKKGTLVTTLAKFTALAGSGGLEANKEYLIIDETIYPDTKFKGVFSGSTYEEALSALEVAFPTATSGDWAMLNGEGLPPIYAVWDDDEDTPLWKMSGTVVTISVDNTNKDVTLTLNGSVLSAELTNPESFASITDLNDYILKTNIENNLTTTDAGKVLDARQGKELDDKKVNRITTGTGNRAYIMDGSNNDTFIGISQGTPVGGSLPYRKSNGFIVQLSGNTASRPTTSLNVGDQYFNTTTNQMEIYIGDTNHWLYQKYSNGDTLPTPAVGTSHTYLVVGNGVATDASAGAIEIYGIAVYGGLVNGRTVIISNVGGTLYFANGDETDTLANLTITSADYTSLLRVA